MSRDIPESDWKQFRKLADLALDRFCQRVLSEVKKLADQSGKSNHERYLAVYRYIEKRDKELADAFNDIRRSVAIMQLARLRFYQLLTDDEYARFSEETRGKVEGLLEIQRG